MAITGGIDGPWSRRLATAALVQRDVAIVTCSLVFAWPWPLAAQGRPADIAAPGEGWFQQALALDLGTDGAPDPARAYAAMRRAAEAGHPQAAFNVAAMLDSGRGTPRDVAEAAIWYARAAARGNARAAYNLGQLYDRGDGVPVNAGLSRAWFAASGLPAARERLKQPGPAIPEHPGPLEAPKPLFPIAAATPAGQAESLELVWTSHAAEGTVRYFVELRELDDLGSREAWAGFTDVSSVSVMLPPGTDHLAWRVSAVTRDTGRYAVSTWMIIRGAGGTLARTSGRQP